LRYHKRVASKHAKLPQARRIRTVEIRVIAEISKRGRIKRWTTARFSVHELLPIESPK
jgi:hypothetical protein